jgi:hypothetical protein
MKAMHRRSTLATTSTSMLGTLARMNPAAQPSTQTRQPARVWIAITAKAITVACPQWGRSQHAVRWPSGQTFR